MKRCFAIILCLPVLCILLALSGCLGKQDQALAPEIEYTEYEGQRCPKLKAAEEDGSVDIVNAEIEAQFRRLMGDGNDDSAVRTFTASTDSMISVLLKAEYDVSYGTDREVWGVCYDYINKTVVPCGAYLAGRQDSYADICKEIEVMLRENGSYEYISVPYYYFDSNSDPVLVVLALEHPDGADAWERVYYYSPVSDLFVDSPFLNS